VSLILEALKKLDREKQAPQRGVLVVGPSAWPSPREGRLQAGFLGVAVLALAGVAAAVWLARTQRTVAVHAPQGGRAATAPAVSPARPVEPGRPAQAAAPGPGTRSVRRPVAEQRAAAEDGAGGPALAGDAAADDGGRGAAGPAIEPPAPADDAAIPAAPSGGPSSRASAREAPRRPGEFELQAISAQDGRPVAVLNDRLVREGDAFDGVRVLRIGLDEVEIEVGGRRRIVKF
jgi:hypothetical protein